MAGDTELDHLKAAQDYAFQRKQAAWEAQDQAWKRRSAAREVMNRAHEERQRAYDVQESSWQACQRVQDACGPRIERLKEIQQAAFENMQRSFNAASSAHDRRDGAMAKSYANDGHRYKEEAREATAERRRLIGEAQEARARHEATKPAFQQAKDRFNQLKHEHDSAKADHERKQAEFQRAKAEFESAKTAFQRRLEVVKAQSKRRKDDKRSIAQRAGVPAMYLDDVWVSTQPDGMVNIYFGGAGAPDGAGHGHYVMDIHGNVTYRREPFDPHGSQNFTEPQYWHKMKMSFDRDSGTFQTDNYVGIVGDKGQKTKAHIVMDSEGGIVFVRDMGGEVLYSRKDGIGYLPDDLDWSK